jgi:hypothetical protein
MQQTNSTYNFILSRDLTQITPDMLASNSTMNLLLFYDFKVLEAMFKVTGTVDFQFTHRLLNLFNELFEKNMYHHMVLASRPEINYHGFSQLSNVIISIPIYYFNNSEDHIDDYEYGINAYSSMFPLYLDYNGSFKLSEFINSKKSMIDTINNEAIYVENYHVNNVYIAYEHDSNNTKTHYCLFKHLIELNNLNNFKYLIDFSKILISELFIYEATYSQQILSQLNFPKTYSIKQLEIQLILSQLNYSNNCLENYKQIMAYFSDIKLASDFCYVNKSYVNTSILFEMFKNNMFKSNPDNENKLAADLLLDNFESNKDFILFLANLCGNKLIFEAYMDEDDKEYAEDDMVYIGNSTGHAIPEVPGYYLSDSTKSFFINNNIKLLCDCKTRVECDASEYVHPSGLMGLLAYGEQDYMLMGIDKSQIKYHKTVCNTICVC